MALKSAVWTALGAGSNMERICFLFQNHQKEPDNPSVATQAHCSCSLLVSSSSTSQSVSNIIRGFIPLFHLHHYCFCFFSNPISHTCNLSQKQTLAHTHTYVLSWLQIHITTLKGTCTAQTPAHAHTRTCPAWMFAWGWSFSSRLMFHQQDST